MARSVDTIQKAIIDDVAAQPEFATLIANTSKRSIWRLWTFVVAVAINLLEQLQDVFQSDVEKTVSLSAPSTPQWIQDRVFKFQYSATNPQIVQLIDLVPQYPTVDANLRIVTRCSVKTTVSNAVSIKVAKSEPPEPLTNDELDALQSYINIIGIAGVNYVVTSTGSDKLFVDADIYYSGMYSAVIKDNVISAITNYLSAIPFDGVLRVSDLELTIKSVTGVNDVVLNNVRARKDTDLLADATYLVQNNAVVGRSWATISGYMVTETTTGNTLNDTLSFIAE